MHFTDYPGNCGKFDMLRNRRTSNDGIKKELGIDTVVGCIKRCYHLLNETCLGFNIKSSNGTECYLIYNQIEFWNLQKSAHFDFYYLKRPCEGNLPTWSNLTWWFPRHLSSVFVREFTDRACACRTISSGGRGLSSTCLGRLSVVSLVFL